MLFPIMLQWRSTSRTWPNKMRQSGLSCNRRHPWVSTASIDGESLIAACCCQGSTLQAHQGQAQAVVTLVCWPPVQLESTGKSDVITSEAGVDPAWNSAI